MHLYLRSTPEAPVRGKHSTISLLAAPCRRDGYDQEEEDDNKLTLALTVTVTVTVTVTPTVTPTLTLTGYEQEEEEDNSKADLPQRLFNKGYLIKAI